MTEAEAEPVPAPARPDGSDVLAVAGAMVVAALLFFIAFKAFLRPSQVNLTLVLVLVAGEVVMILGAVALAGVHWRHLSWRDLGFLPVTEARWYWIAGGSGLIVLPLLAAAVALALEHGGLEVDDAMGGVVAEAARNPLALATLALLACGLGPLAEEVLFRGLVFAWLRGRFGVPAGLAASSLLFGLAHGKPAYILVTGTVGLGLGLLYHRSRSLWPSVLAHGLYNAVALASSAFGV